MGKISVIQYDKPKLRRTIISQSQVFAIAVDPNAGYLFYSSITRPAKIFRSYLDGSNVKVIRQQGLSLPYSLSVDYENKRLYWSDSHLSKIQYSDYDGNNTVTLLTSRLVVPVSISVYKYNLFYIDMQLASIFKTSKYYGSSATLLRANLNNLYQLKVFAADLQTTVDNHPCARQNGDCSHFCFAVPSTNSQYALSRHCGCPYGLKLDTNMATCISNPDEQVVNTCLAPNYFKCSNNRCIR